MTVSVLGPFEIHVRLRQGPERFMTRHANQYNLQSLRQNAVKFTLGDENTEPPYRLGDFGRYNSVLGITEVFRYGYTLATNAPHQQSMPLRGILNETDCRLHIESHPSVPHTAFKTGNRYFWGFGSDEAFNYGWEPGELYARPELETVGTGI